MQLAMIRAVLFAVSSFRIYAKPLRLPGNYTVPTQVDLGFGYKFSGLPDGSDHETAMRFALELRAKSVPEEQKMLLTLLRTRGEWAEGAPELLRDVMTRTPQRRLGPGGQEMCQLKTTEAECILEKDDTCNPCFWKSSTYSTPECSAFTCGDYNDETACCANVRAVQTGCKWEGWCTDAYFASSDSGMSGEGDCPPVECATCLKDGLISGTNYDSIARAERCNDLHSARTGKCESECSDAAHCDSEVECLFYRTKGKDPCMTQRCPARAANPSCGGALSRAPDESSQVSQECDAQCDEMQSTCGSCGEEVCSERAAAAVIIIVVIILVIVVIICAIVCGIIACWFCCCRANKGNAGGGGAQPPVVVGVAA